MFVAKLGIKIFCVIKNYQLIFEKGGFKMTQENQEPTQVANKKTSGLGIAALILGVVGLVGSWIPILNNISAFIAFFGVILGVIGIISISKSKGTKGGKGISIAGTLVSVVAIVVVLATQSMYGQVADDASKSLDKMSGDATEELLNKDVSVDFGEYTVETQDYGSGITSQSGYLAVTVKNLASDSKSYSIHFEALDASGTRIQDDYIYANSLASGQTESNKIFTAVSDEYVEKYKGATFKIVEVSQY